MTTMENDVSQFHIDLSITCLKCNRVTVIDVSEPVGDASTVTCKTCGTCFGRFPAFRKMVIDGVSEMLGGIG